MGFSAAECIGVGRQHLEKAVRMHVSFVGMVLDCDEDLIDNAMSFVCAHSGCGCYVRDSSLSLSWLYMI